MIDAVYSRDNADRIRLLQAHMQRLALPTFLALLTVAAHAETPAYVGTWAADKAQCARGQEDENAPVVVSAKGYDRHETHCKFATVTRKGSG